MKQRWDRSDDPETQRGQTGRQSGIDIERDLDFNLTPNSLAWRETRQPATVTFYCPVRVLQPVNIKKTNKQHFRNRIRFHTL